MHEELTDLVKKLEAGETAVYADDHAGNLLDGYAEQGNELAKTL